MRFSLLRGLLGIAVVAALLGGCREERDPILPPGPETAGREYFPMSVGRFWEYDVKDIHWSFNRDSVARYQFREFVDTVFRGATGELNYRIVRSRRADSTGTWREDSATVVILQADLVRRTAANVPTLELLFPVREGKSWNLNIFNSLDSTMRTYRQVGAARTLTGGPSFARTLSVVDEPQLNLVQQREQEAVYAWNVGCVYRRRLSYDFCNEIEASQGLCRFGEGYKARGLVREEQLRNWGPR